MKRGGINLPEQILLSFGIKTQGVTLGNSLGLDRVPNDDNSAKLEATPVNS
jgi:hypothetical protein